MFFSGIISQPLDRISQTSPHFIQNFMINITVSHEDWDLVCRFGANEPKIIFRAKLGNNMSDFYKQPLILFKIIWSTLFLWSLLWSIFFFFWKLISHGDWDLPCFLGNNLTTTCQILTNNPLFYSKLYGKKKKKKQKNIFCENLVSHLVTFIDKQM